ncbi:unnamed protein product [Auanema sp. JU1783]|nr:unnamed protein product [Auanema sp. JU1783]
MIFIFIWSLLIHFSDNLIINNAQPSNHPHHVVHHNMSSEERMQVTYRVLNDGRLSHAKKLATITNNTRHPHEETHRIHESMIHNMLLLKRWLDKRVETEPIIVQAVQQRKFKLLFTLPGEKHYKRLVKQTKRIIDEMSVHEMTREKQVEKEFHDKAYELGIHAISAEIIEHHENSNSIDSRVSIS